MINFMCLDGGESLYSWNKLLQQKLLINIKRRVAVFQVEAYP